MSGRGRQPPFEGRLRIGQVGYRQRCSTDRRRRPGSTPGGAPPAGTAPRGGVSSCPGTRPAVPPPGVRQAGSCSASATSARSGRSRRAGAPAGQRHARRVRAVGGRRGRSARWRRHRPAACEPIDRVRPNDGREQFCDAPEKGLCRAFGIRLLPISPTGPRVSAPGVEYTVSTSLRTASGRVCTPHPDPVTALRRRPSPGIPALLGLMPGSGPHPWSP